MRRTPILAAFWIAIAVVGSAWLALAPAKVSAQDDVRGILPYIMLIVDTSGSMERLPSCECSTPACGECLPNCNSTDLNLKKNRWAVTLEALTGQFNNFQCEPIARTVNNGMSYDLGYYLPYHQPWDCGGLPAGTPCPYNSTASTLSQQTNGILDLNSSGVRFGLMTFDGWDTYIGAPPLVPSSEFDETLSNGVQGLWSYGDPSSTSEVGRFHYPNCVTEYRMDKGARSPIAAEGSLISLESCTGGGTPGSSPTCPAWCTSCTATQQTINTDIQEALLSARPYGGTPIAASLDDLYYHLNDDLSDEFQGCRDRYALLITDGYPDDDYRSYGCNCDEEGDPMDPNRCGPPPNDPADMKCPYPTAEDAARDLVEGRGGDDPMVERVYIVGLAVNDPTVVSRLNAIADSGCTGTAVECENGDPDNHQALFADDIDSLRAAVQTIVSETNRPVSRTIPVFALSNNPDSPQYQFTTALKIGLESGDPWTGILERRRWDCGLTPPAFATLNESMGDLFHERLNDLTLRHLFTSFPTSGTANLDGTIHAMSGSCGTSGCPMYTLDDSLVTPAMLGAGTSAERDAILAWMYGAAGSSRDDARLGAVYHSSPVVVGAPSFDTADASYNEFRRAPLIAERPQVLYIGTNDGILHAFSTGVYSKPATAPLSWRNLGDGEELWGFVPPMLLNDIRTSMTTHQTLMDGTPVVKNVNVNLSLGAAGYRTILVTGMREGGNAYMALDVTDPFVPRFLWQVSSPVPVESPVLPLPPGVIGRTYAKPAIIQATFRRPPPGGGATVIKNGAIAILPGGVGNLAPSTPGCNGASNETMRNGSARFDSFSPQADGSTPILQVRADVRCWGPSGRSLMFVDVQDGYIVKTIYLSNPTQSPSSSNEPFFTAPLVSAPAAFPDEIGAISTRAFITDADGLIWRIDMRGEGGNDPVPNDPMRGWTARPFHDIFWDQLPDGGELTYEPPMVSSDTQGRPVVIVGTGDTSDFVKSGVRNRIVSLTEVETAVAVDSPLHYKASLNWEIRERGNVTRTTAMTDGTPITVDGLATSELVTGPMGLFEGQLYVGTFIAITDTTDVCDLGRGRIHAVDYVQRDFVDSNGSSPNTYGPYRVNAGTTASDNIVNIQQTNSAGNNVMITGLTVTQRPSCADADASYTDPWGETWSGSEATPPADVYLVAHAERPPGDSSLVNTRGGSEVFGLEVRLTPPVRVSTISSWATSVD